MSKIFNFFKMLILMLVAIKVNIVEAILMAISFTLRFIGFIINEVFKKISIWVAAVTAKFNFITIFRKNEE